MIIIFEKTRKMCNGDIQASGNWCRLISNDLPNDCSGGFYSPEIEEIDFTDYIYVWKKGDGYVVVAKTESIDNAKNNKVAEINTACQEAIIAGVDVNGEHFSYAMTDQNNISNLVQLTLKTGLSLPYHADGEGCRMFNKEELIALYVAQEVNVTGQITYANQLKRYVNSLNQVDYINSVAYGDSLTGEYLDTYNDIMSNAQKAVEKFIKG